MKCNGRCYEDLHIAYQVLSLRCLSLTTNWQFAKISKRRHCSSRYLDSLPMWLAYIFGWAAWSINQSINLIFKHGLIKQWTARPTSMTAENLQPQLLNRLVLRVGVALLLWPKLFSTQYSAWFFWGLVSNVAWLQRSGGQAKIQM